MGLTSLSSFVAIVGSWFCLKSFLFFEMAPVHPFSHNQLEQENKQEKNIRVLFRQTAEHVRLLDRPAPDPTNGRIGCPACRPCCAACASAGPCVRAVRQRARSRSVRLVSRRCVRAESVRRSRVSERGRRGGPRRPGPARLGHARAAATART